MGLDRLMERKGVVAAGQFSSDGTLVRGVGALTEEEMEKVARSCAAHEKATWNTATDLRESTTLDWGNLNGWVLWAGTLALCVSGNIGVFVDAYQADFNEIMNDLIAPESGGGPGNDTR